MSIFSWKYLQSSSMSSSVMSSYEPGWMPHASRLLVPPAHLAAPRAKSLFATAAVFQRKLTSYYDSLVNFIISDLARLVYYSSLQVQPQDGQHFVLDELVGLPHVVARGVLVLHQVCVFFQHRILTTPSRRPNRLYLPRSYCSP